MYVVHDESVEKGKFLTCPQQIYNYEMACQKRQSSRERQKRLRAKKSGLTEHKNISDIGENLNNVVEVLDNPQKENRSQKENDNVALQNIAENNPFGIGEVSEELFR